MTATRSRRQRNNYDAYLAAQDKTVCDFCKLESSPGNQVISKTESFLLIHNIFPYSLWDGQRVSDHLLIVPKKHIDSLKDLTPEQSAEFVQLMSAYEDKGYNVYARAPGSTIKSVVHQHTHLIKTTGRLRFLVLVMKPYIRWFH